METHCHPILVPSKLWDSGKMEAPALAAASCEARETTEANGAVLWERGSGATNVWDSVKGATLWKKLIRQPQGMEGWKTGAQGCPARRRGGPTNQLAEDGQNSSAEREWGVWGRKKTQPVRISDAVQVR